MEHRLRDVRGPMGAVLLVQYSWDSQVDWSLSLAWVYLYAMNKITKSNFLMMPPCQVQLNHVFCHRIFGGAPGAPRFPYTLQASQATTRL